MITAETTVRQRLRLDGELAKIGEGWYRSETDAAAGGSGKAKAPRMGLVTEAIRTTQEEAERLHCERQAAAEQGRRTLASLYRREGITLMTTTTQTTTARRCRWTGWAHV